MYCITRLKNIPKYATHQAAVAIEEKIYQFGSDFMSCIDLHVLCTSTLTWTHHTLEERPFLSDNKWFTAVAYEDNVYIWTACSNLYCFNTARVSKCWRKPKTEGPEPPARTGYSACVWRHYMYIFGGRPALWLSEDLPLSIDVHVLDLKTMRWVQHRFENFDQAPGLRIFFSTAVIGDQMYMFGGIDPRRMLCWVTMNTRLIPKTEYGSPKLWRYDFLENKWNNYEENGVVPMSRQNHSAFVYNKKMYIFGGFQVEYNEYLNDMFEFNPTTGTWKNVYMNGVDGPCKRSNCGSVVIDNRWFLIGGIGTENKKLFSINHKRKCYRDMFLCDIHPNLSTLTMLAIRKYHLDESKLPVPIRLEIKNLFTPYKDIIQDIIQCHSVDDTNEG